MGCRRQYAYRRYGSKGKKINNWRGEEWGRAWRRTVQVLSFGVFGVGALGLAFVVFPSVWLLPISRDRKTDCIQWLIHSSFRFFLGFISVLGGMEFEWVNGGALLKNDACLLVANHPTLLDVVLLISRLPQADCIVKRELFSNPFLRDVVRWAGYIANDGGAVVLDQAIERIRRSRKVIVFPEGTRSGRDGLKPFNQGFAHIAVRAPCKIVPILIRCRPITLAKGDGLFSVPKQRPRLTATAGESVAPSDFFLSSDPVPVAVRKVTAAMADYFQERVAHDRREHFRNRN